MSECKGCQALEVKLDGLRSKLRELEDQCDTCDYSDHVASADDLDAALAVIYELHNVTGICLCEHCNAHRCNR